MCVHTAFGEQGAMAWRPAIQSETHKSLPVSSSHDKRTFIVINRPSGTGSRPMSIQFCTSPTCRGVMGVAHLRCVGCWSTVHSFHPRWQCVGFGGSGVVLPLWTTIAQWEGNARSVTHPPRSRHTHRFLNPRLGRRRCRGVCPPSKPRGMLTLVRFFCPFMPRPLVLPSPDPIPRPTRFRCRAVGSLARGGWLVCRVRE